MVGGGGTDTTKTHKKTVCKVRGITLNYSISQLVNFDVIRDMILKTGRTTTDDDVVTVHPDKKLNVSEKRMEECTFFRNQRTRFTEFRFSRGDDYTIIIRFRSVICPPTNPEKNFFIYINKEWRMVTYISHVRVAQVQANFYLYNSGS